MNEDLTETERTASDQVTPVKIPRRNIFFSLQRYGHRKFPSFIPAPDYREILRTSRERDEEDNAKTEPPSDELIDLRCIWAVEFYTPSHVAQLLRGFKKLGWDREDPAISERSPALWIERIRETAHGGGWFNLGPIHRPGDRRFFHHGRKAQLPPHVDYALAAMYSLTSSITCIVICFILDENFTKRFDETLRRKRETILEPITGGGYRLHDPQSQKTTDIQAIRAAMRASAANWFRSQLPGLFTSGIIEDECPTCEFVTLRKARPFPKQDERDPEAKEWLRLLDMDNDIHVWQADKLPYLKFAWPLLYDKKSRFHAVIAAREDAFLNENLQAYGGGDRSSYVICVDEHVKGLLSRWALLGVLSSFERHLNNIRDSAIFKSTQRERPLHLLRELTGHLSQSVDITAASVELRHFTKQEVPFEYELETFTPSDPRFYRDKDITLSQGLRKQIEDRSVWLENLDNSVRDLFIQYGTVIGTRENIKLQKSIGILTWVMVIITIFIALLTALLAYITFITSKISWPW